MRGDRNFFWHCSKRRSILIVVGVSPNQKLFADIKLINENKNKAQQQPGFSPPPRE